MTDWITITNGELTAQVNPLGAELSSLTDADGREWMTDADPAFWSGRAPLLFPVVGKPAGEVIRVDGVAYPMKQHGFARRLRFEVVEAGEAQAVFALSESDETRKHYPFAFRLEVAFRLYGPSLAIDVTVANTGAVPMPASFGFHPAFAWPLPGGPLPGGAAKEDHRIVFSADEPGRLKAIAADGTIAVAEVDSPLDGARTLHLTDALFAHDALVWDPVVSQAVSYGVEGGPELEIGFPDTPMLGIWSKPGAHFVCVEPWHGIADPEGYAGEFADKPGVFTVAPGEAKRIGMSVTLRS